MKARVESQRAAATERVDRPATPVGQLLPRFQAGPAGAAAYQLIRELFGECRSITGNGLRATLRRLQAEMPLEIREVPSGTRVFDWVVPDEWNIQDGYIADVSGRRVVDFRESNLRVVNYSVPVRQRMSRAELAPHVHTLAAQPELVPYRTSYYERTWGFCLSQREWEALPDGEYDICIDATLKPGSLSYGELYLPGATTEEILISTHVCHPTLANDNLSGLAVCTGLARLLAPAERRFSYRFLFAPGTIGAITWLARNVAQTSRIRHGLVVACVGDRGGLHYKQSRRGDAEIDRVAAAVLRARGRGAGVRPFSPYGYDERQYCSPGFNLPVGNLSRTPFGEFPEYHTSADNLEFVTPAALADSLQALLEIVGVLERNCVYRSTQPMCEPALGPRGLYGLPGAADREASRDAVLWLLNLADGAHSVLDVHERSGLPLEMLFEACDALVAGGLLVDATAGLQGRA